MQKRICAAAVCFSLAAPALRAQMPGASQQVDTVQQRREFQESADALGGTNSVPELYGGEADDVGPQSVLQAAPQRWHLDAFADAQYFYTDNMFLTSQSRQSADVLVSTVQAALSCGPHDVAGGALSPGIGYAQQWFNFDLTGSGTENVYGADPSPFVSSTVKLNAFDFTSSTAFADLTWRRQNWVLALGTDFRWLLDSASYNGFYREYVPHWTVRREFPLSANTAVSVGYEGDYRFTDTRLTPDANYPGNYEDRTDHSLELVGSWRICPHLILQPFYRLEYSHYTRTDRDDVLNSLGLTIACPLTANVTVRAFAGYDTLHTDGFLAQSYDALNLGGGLNLSVRF